MFLKLLFFIICVDSKLLSGSKAYFFSLVILTWLPFALCGCHGVLLTIFSNVVRYYVSTAATHCHEVLSYHCEEGARHRY